jgi:hypothetical protein
LLEAFTQGVVTMKPGDSIATVITSHAVSHRNVAARWIIPVLIALAVLMPVRSFAQRLDGTLQVAVTDKTGGVVPGAKVTATNEDTKVVVNATSNGDVYVFPNLLPGQYLLTVEKDSFKKYERQHVNVLPNQVTDAKAELELGSVSEAVTVQEEGESAVKTTSSDLSVGISGPVAEQLPVGFIGGHVQELAVILPNTTTQPGGVAGDGGSVGGLRPRFNSFTIDGADDNSYDTSSRLIPVIEDAVSDFTVLTNQFSAQYGHSAGGIFAVTTKSGTNDIHGEVHEYNRNRTYDAADNQETSRGHKDRYDYNRVGASVGGPIFKNKLFYFGAFEYQDEAKASSGPTVNTPTAAGLTTLKGLAHDAAVVNILNQFATASAASSTSPVTVGGVTTLIPVGTFQGLAPNFTHEHDFQIGINWNVGKHSVRGRVMYDRERQPEVNAVEPQPQFNGTRNQDGRKFILNDAWTLTPTLVNNFTFAFTHFVGPQLVVPTAFANFPNVEVDNLGVDIGPNGCSPQTQVINIYQWSDSVTKVISKHTITAGAEVRNNISPTNALPRSRGEWDYKNLTSLINDTVPDGANGALRGAGIGSFAANFKSFYAFGQDDWKITNRLTLNLGLRYEYNEAPRDAGLQALNAISNDPKFGFVFRKQMADTNNWAPRAGFAFDPTGSGKWAIRGGAGVFYDITVTNFDLNLLPPQLQSEQNPTLTCSLPGAPAWCTNPSAGFLQSGGLLQVNVPPATQALARKATQGLMVDIVEPKIFSWSLSVQHQLPGNTTVELRYVGNHALSLPAQIRLNSASAFDSRFPGGGITPLPTYLSASSIPAKVATPASTLQSFDNFNTQPLAVDGFLSSFTTDPPAAASIYHSGSVTAIHRVGHGLYIQGDYTWAHTDDDATNEFFTSRVNPRRAQDGLNLRADWGRSALDIRQKFALGFVYNVPNIRMDNAIARQFLHGWEWSGTYLAESGQPVTALSGVDSNDNGDSAGDRVILNQGGIANTGSVVDEVCNDGAGGATRVVTAVSATCADANVVGYVAEKSTAQFIQAGVGAKANVGRNTINTPGLNVWNMSFIKNFTITERYRLQFRLETYDTFNHPNFSIGLPSNDGPHDQNDNPNPLSTAFPFVTSGNLFLNSSVFNGGSRKMQLGLKFTF